MKRRGKQGKTGEKSQDTGNFALLNSLVQNSHHPTPLCEFLGSHSEQPCSGDVSYSFSAGADFDHPDSALPSWGSFSTIWVFHQLLSISHLPLQCPTQRPQSPMPLLSRLLKMQRSLPEPSVYQHHPPHFWSFTYFTLCISFIIPYFDVLYSGIACITDDASYIDIIFV